MKKSFVLIGLIGLISLVGCKKEQQVTDMRFTATIEQADKSYFNISNEPGNPAKVTWKAGDEVWVNGNIFTTTNTSADGQTAELVGEATPTPPYYAFYPTDLNPEYNSYGNCYRITLPDTQTYYVENEVHAPMYAYTEDNNMMFRDLCGMLVLNLQATGKTLRSITVVTAEKQISGTFNIEGTAASPVLGSYPCDGTVTLDCGTDGVSINTATNFYIYLPPYNYSNLVLIFKDVDNAICTKSFQAGGNGHSTFNVVRSQYNLLTFSGLTFTTPAPEGAINGLFSVSSTKQVYFSKGNLLEDGSFAEEQTYTFGSSLFGSSQGNSLPIPSGWSILSAEEWEYFVNTRSTNNTLSAGARYTMGSVGDELMLGMILFPDNYVHPTITSDMSNAVYNAPSLLNDWYASPKSMFTISYPDWKLMEAAGAVFLPAGWRPVTNTGGWFPLDESTIDWENWQTPSIIPFYLPVGECRAAGLYYSSSYVQREGRTKQKSFLFMDDVYDLYLGSNGDVMGGDVILYHDYWSGAPEGVVLHNSAPVCILEVDTANDEWEVPLSVRPVKVAN